LKTKSLAAIASGDKREKRVKTDPEAKRSWDVPQDAPRANKRTKFGLEKEIKKKEVRLIARRKGDVPALAKHRPTERSAKKKGNALVYAEKRGGPAIKSQSRGVSTGARRDLPKKGGEAVGKEPREAIEKKQKKHKPDQKEESNGEGRRSEEESSRKLLRPTKKT